jgi:hypothetical protein
MTATRSFHWPARVLLCLLLTGLQLGLMACGGEGGEGGADAGADVTPEGSVELTGAVQKGPLVLVGSPVPG